MNDIDTSVPLDLGPLSPISDLAGIIMQQQKAEDDLWMEELMQEEVDLTKLKGLEATRKVINTWNNSKDYQWGLLSISSLTANKLLQGGFQTFNDLFEFNLENEDPFKKIEILYRMTKNKIRKVEICVIETIFIDE